jgi:hypothetical protein
VVDGCAKCNDDSLPTGRLLRVLLFTITKMTREQSLGGREFPSSRGRGGSHDRKSADSGQCMHAMIR